jgi:hypothetical protein
MLTPTDLPKPNFEREGERSMRGEPTEGVNCGSTVLADVPSVQI